MNLSTAPLFGPTTSFRKLAVGAAFFLCGVVSLLRAQSLGSIQGVVIDAESKAFITGAIVTVAGTDLQASTDRAGLYRFAAVPAGTHTLADRKSVV